MSALTSRRLYTASCRVMGLFLMTVALLALTETPSKAAPTKLSPIMPEAFEPVRKQDLIPQKPGTYRLSASITKNLPQAMYGTWSIVARVSSSDAPPHLFVPSSSEIWALEKNQTDITLTNVVSTASSTIEVDNVSGNTATFHHTALSRNGRLRVIETPTITVNHDHLSGKNEQVLEFLDSDEQTKRRFTIVYEVIGTRLAGAKVTFGPDPDGPTFEIAPMQFEDE